MKMLKRWCAVIAVWMMSGLMLAAQQPTRQDEFVPIDQLPPQEQVAALPLLVAAYVFVPVVLFMYLLSLARRMAAVSREIERLELDLKRPGRT